MAEVVDLYTRSAFQESYAAFARRRIIAARSALDISVDAFATMLTPLVGWPVTAKAVEAWETNSVPPGDVLVAADSAASADADQNIGSILGSIPPSFTAKALNGYWVTAFQFGAEAARKQHVDIAMISAESERFMTITNHPPTPRSEGRASPFCNDLQAQLANRHLVGHWKNSSDTRYFGTFHLAVLSGETVMAGYYTGFGSDIEVSTGAWKWVRLSEDSIADMDLSTVRLRDPAVLGPVIGSHSQYDPALTLADIEQEP